MSIDYLSAKVLKIFIGCKCFTVAICTTNQWCRVPPPTIKSFTWNVVFFLLRLWIAQLSISYLYHVKSCLSFTVIIQFTKVGLEGHNILFIITVTFSKYGPHKLPTLYRMALIQFAVLWDWRLVKYLNSNLRPGFRHMHKNWTRLFGNYRKDMDQYYHNLLQLNLYQ